MLIGQGALTIPDGADMVAIARSAGQTHEPPRPPAESVSRTGILDLRANE